MNVLIFVLVCVGMIPLMLMTVTKRPASRKLDFVVLVAATLAWAVAVVNTADTSYEQGVRDAWLCGAVVDTLSDGKTIVTRVDADVWEDVGERWMCNGRYIWRY